MHVAGQGCWVCLLLLLLLCVWGEGYYLYHQHHHRCCSFCHFMWFFIRRRLARLTERIIAACSSARGCWCLPLITQTWLSSFWLTSSFLFPFAFHRLSACWLCGRSMSLLTLTVVRPRSWGSCCFGLCISLCAVFLHRLNWIWVKAWRGENNYKQINK